MEYHDRHERKLVKALNELGFDLAGITPFKNSDKFYFYKRETKQLWNIEIIYNGVGYCLSVGKNNVFKAINLKFGLSWEKLFEEIKIFLDNKK